MAKKNDTAATADDDVSDTPEVVVVEQPTVDENAVQPSAQTLAEMAAGREALAKHANNP